MAEYLKPNQEIVYVENGYMIELERLNYEYQGYRSLVTQFTSETPFKPDQERYDQLLEKYIISYMEYNVIFNHIIHKFVPEKYQTNNVVASFELSALLIDK